jgi:hypothetical protein
MKSMFNSHEGIFGKAKDEEVNLGSASDTKEQLDQLRFAAMKGRADAAAEQATSSNDEFLVQPCREHPFGITKKEAERNKVALMVGDSTHTTSRSQVVLSNGDVQGMTFITNPFIDKPKSVPNQSQDRFAAIKG